jgi:branched-chain amino acid transport system ATP-binding protein
VTEAPLLALDRLTRHFGALAAVSAVSLEIAARERRAIIGPNGAGKTTLIGQIMGDLQPDAGCITFGGVDLLPLAPPRRAALGLGRTFQITQLLGEETVLDNVTIAVQARQGHSFHFWRDARSDQSLQEPAHRALEEVGLAGRTSIRVADLAQGERKQLELAVALVLQPRLLVLDEPMAGLGPAESQAMTRMLLALKGRVAMLLVEHDMEAVFALADRLSVLVYGRCIATGHPDIIRRDPRVLEAYLTQEVA